jgi:putative DNA primase/helicase
VLLKGKNQMSKIIPNQSTSIKPQTENFPNQKIVLSRDYYPIEESFDVVHLETQVIQAISGKCITPHDRIIFDGSFHRFSTNGKSNDKAGWYIFFDDGIPAGAFGNWREGISYKWRADIGRELSRQELEQIDQKQKKAQQIRENELDKQYQKASIEAARIWEEATPATEHPYLKKKGIKPHIAKISTTGDLIIPVYDDSGTISSIQRINRKGGKFFLENGKVSGGYCILGNLDCTEKVYLAEGFSTSASIYEASNIPTIVSNNSGNMKKVALLFRNKYPELKIIIVADNDESGVGQKAAQEAADICNGRVITPPEIGDANDFALSNGNLRGLLLNSPLFGKTKRFSDLVKEELKPRKWFVEGLFTVGLNIIAGKKATGKSFFSLQAGNAIAGGVDFLGRKTIKGKVLYLANELDDGDMHERICTYGQTIHENYFLVTELIGRGIQAVSTLKEEIEIEKYDVVIIDMLTGIIEEGMDTNSYNGSAFWNLIRMMAKEQNCCIIGLWHSPKSLNSKDHVDQVMGSVGAAGQSDSILTISKDRHSIKATIEVTSNHSAGTVQQLLFESLEWTINPNQKPSKERKNLDDAWRSFERCWFGTGAETVNDKPYLDKLKAVKYTEENLGNTKATAKKYWSPSGSFVKPLTKAQIIEKHDNGFIVIEPEKSTALMLLKNDKIK